MPNVWEPGLPTNTELDSLFQMLRQVLPDLNVDRGWLTKPRADDNDQLWTFWVEDRRESVQLEPATSGYLIEGNGPDRRREVRTVEEAAATIVEWLGNS
jgi:hypothetical protein